MTQYSSTSHQDMVTRPDTRWKHVCLGLLPMSASTTYSIYSKEEKPRLIKKKKQIKKGTQIKIDMESSRGDNMTETT